MLVSNTSRIVDIGVASKAPTTPMPALLTSTSIGPIDAKRDATLSGLVTSSAITRSRPDSGSRLWRGVRIVAITSNLWRESVAPFQGRSQRSNQ